MSDKSLKQSIENLFRSTPDDDFNKINFKDLSNFQVDTSKLDRLAVVSTNSNNSIEAYPDNALANRQINLLDAIKIALQRNPEISQSIATLAAQNSNIDVAKAQYYPQLTGGISTGDMTSGERGRQLLTLSATQLLYDFGKVKSSVDTQKAKQVVEQANVLVSIDDIAYQVASAAINIERYKRVSQIGEQQISGIQRILDIANLRANAGISSQADPIQAQSYLQSAQSSLIAQQSLLKQYQQRLRTLIGFDISNKNWSIPADLVQSSDLYQDPEFNTIPKMIAAQAEVEVAKSQKKQTQLSLYPTLSVKGSLSQALNGVNPNNNKDDGFYNSIMLEASSNFYQGGAVAAQTRSASYAEEAARSKVNAVYLDVLDRLRTTREDIENKQRQIQVLSERQATTVKTRELYQEQYKLGTRSVLDLLNAEMAIHSANNELEMARYDIYNSLVQFIQTTGRTRQAYKLNNISIQGFEVQP
ncbi:TolC family outer membrane protein [Acinetobacter baumannii]|nr:TolC family outer membrane protein [Acinetobacter baumannii]MDC4617291.1 TolC family outer membrane protein [Acinetobacter baumannii]MDC4865473.1 TolC family outer membrane protein [Acinetobacter baumannii]MDC5156248.1 TolC family outer membrane protein [Acinetobacter baumannii]MDC5568898.1 TolC family outer membrane protein [Acinetobacter baumannii]